MCKFKVGDKVKRTEDSNKDVVRGAVYTVRDFDKFGDLEFEGLPDFGYNVDAFEIYTTETLPLCTSSELNEIEELRDRVEYLESLCEDYAKIIAEKGAEFKPISDMTIEDWKQASDHGWIFETREGELLKVSEVDELHDYPVKAGGMSFTTEGRWNISKQDIDDIVKRIK